MKTYKESIACADRTSMQLHPTGLKGGKLRESSKNRSKGQRRRGYI